MGLLKIDMSQRIVVYVDSFPLLKEGLREIYSGR